MRVVPFGPRAVLVHVGDEISPEVLSRVLVVDRTLRAVPGVAETVPAYASVLVLLDRPMDVGELERRLSSAPIEGGTAPAGESHEVPVAYGGVHGPDLGRVARWADLSEDQVVALHSGTEYLVYMLGFAPGFPYMGTVPERIAAPRLPQPRPRVPTGSVGIAGGATGIYPAPTPGGWNLIGRTPLGIFDPARTPPALLEVGDRVRFVPIPPESFAEPPPPRVPEGEEGRPAIVVLQGGLCTTVQDLGRVGHRRHGVPPSGAMDSGSFLCANAAVGNPPEAAALEFTWPAPVLEALVDLTIAIVGADFAAEIDAQPVPPARPVRWRRGQVLRFRALRGGMWAYLAVAGGIAVPVVLGSRSTYVRSGLGGFAGRKLRTGDVLRVGEAWAATPAELPEAQSGPIRVLPGPHLDLFPSGALDRFVNTPYTLSHRSDRTGYRLEGPPIPHAGPGEILSQGMIPGAIQVPPTGQPIVLMRDGPTTGGYPVLAVVCEEEIGRLSQNRPHKTIRFVLG